MFSKEESKEIIKEFWTNFGIFSQRKRIAMCLPKKWVSHNTGINCLSLKFDFEGKQALVGIEINSNSDWEGEEYYEKLLAMKNILDSRFKESPIWDPDYRLPSYKYVKKIFHQLSGVNIHNKSCWPQVFQFFFEYMLVYEEFYLEFKEIITDKD